jgi:hypothetical protein
VATPERLLAAVTALVHSDIAGILRSILTPPTPEPLHRHRRRVDITATSHTVVASICTTHHAAAVDTPASHTLMRVVQSHISRTSVATPLHTARHRKLQLAI